MLTAASKLCSTADLRYLTYDVRTGSSAYLPRCLLNQFPAQLYQYLASSRSTRKCLASAVRQPFVYSSPTAARQALSTSTATRTPAQNTHCLPSKRFRTSQRRCYSVENGSQKDLSNAIRLAMRSMAQPVTIVTSQREGSVSGTHSSTQGATLSTFTVVTLNPEPHISFSIKRPSSTLDAILKSRKFKVHLLSANEHGLTLANAFASGKPQQNVEADPKVSKGDDTISSPRDDMKHPTFCTLSCEIGAHPPLGIGEHTLIIGKVVQVDAADGVKMSDTETSCGLFYHHGRYKRPWGGELQTSSHAEAETVNSIARAFLNGSANAPSPSRKSFRNRFAGIHTVNWKASVSLAFWRNHLQSRPLEYPARHLTQARTLDVRLPTAGQAKEKTLQSVYQNFHVHRIPPVNIYPETSR